MNGKKKAGLVTAGAVAALLAASPLAFATDEPGPAPDGKQCAFTGGSASADSAITGDSWWNDVRQMPWGGNNAGNSGNCSDFLNGNGNGNLSGNEIVVPAPALPEIPVQDVPKLPAPDAP
jgi:hypothetical protein